jgi:esterase/lipase superfamily enzyme
MSDGYRGALIAVVLGLITCGGTGCVTAPSSAPSVPAPAAAPPVAANGHTAAKKESLATRIKIFYATDRQRTGKDDPNEYFGNAEAQGLTYGTISVSIPPSPVHTRGVIERPKWYRLEFSENPKKHVMLLRPVTELDAPTFFSELHQDVDESERKELFVFIHGFYNSFQDAALRTAQIAYDVGFTGRDGAGVPIMYSWASNDEGPPLGYTRDRTRVSHTLPRLTQFLTDLAKDTGASRINIIAHSMGTDLFGQAITELARLKDAPVFNQIILAAPDIDQKVFERDIAPKLVALSERTTVYTSSGDLALKTSYEVNGERRVGDSTNGPLVVKGVETVDVSKVDFGLIGHSIYAEARPVLDDMLLLLAYGLPASRRNLPSESSTGGLEYWVVPQ